MTELNQLIDTLKPLLVEYLQDQGVTVGKSGALQCINPNHSDTHSSMQVATRSDNEYCYCHSCGASYDIFNAASALEDLPTDGPDWIEFNVLELASRYSINYDQEAIHRFTHSDPRAREAFRAYAHTAAMIAESELSDKAKEYVKERDWDTEIINKFGLGSIGSYQLVQGLLASGFASELLDEIGLTDNKLFNDNNLIFPIKNEHRKVVGFSARTFSDKLPKYTNSPSFSPYSPYHKNKIFYNIDKIKEFPGPIYIVEGQSDAIDLWKKSINAVALCGSTLSNEQINILNQQAATRIVIWPDFDYWGFDALTKKIIPNALANQLNPIPEILLPIESWSEAWKTIRTKGAEGVDPSSYISNYGRPNADHSSVTYTPVIEFYSQHLKDTLDISRDKLAERLVDMVAGYSSPIARSIFAKQIAKTTDISETAIYSRLEELDKRKQELADERRQQIVSQAAKSLSREPGNASKVMLNALADLDAVSHAEDNLSSSSFMNQIKDIRVEEEQRTDEFPGLIIPGFKPLQEAFTGEWKGKFIVFAGDENPQPLYSRILTPDGWTTMGQIKQHDCVFDGNGQPTTVVNVYPQGEKDIYRITLSDGTQTDCTPGHLWKVQTDNDRRRGNKFRVLPTAFLMHDYRKQQPNGQLKYKYYIPYPKPIDYSKKIAEEGYHLNIHPYLLGVLIGRGGLTSHPRITTKDKFIVDKCKTLLEKDGYQLNQISDTISYSISRDSNTIPLNKKILDLELNVLSHQKFIPLKYFTVDIQHRIELLQGLMDTNGTITKNGWCSYTTTSAILANHVQRLVRELGGRATIEERTTSYKNKEGNNKNGRKSYRLSICLTEDIDIFSLPRKKNRRRKMRGVSWPTRTITNIEYIGKHEAQCIELASQEHTYITDNHIVTHNTGKSTLSLAIMQSIATHLDNNAMLIVHATDDGLREIMPKVICMMDNLVGDGQLNYLNITNPKFNATPKEVRNILAQRKKAYDKFFEFVRDERIIIKDKKAGADLEFTKALIRYYRTRYPDRHIILLLDSVNRVRVPFGMNGDIRKEVTYISNTMADLAVQNDCTTAAVCEFNRLENKAGFFRPGHVTWPTNRRLAESRALQFDAKAVVLLYNDVHDKGKDQAAILWRDFMGEVRPRIVACVTKNKISNTKDKIFMNFWDNKGQFTPIDQDVARQEYIDETNRLIAEQEGGVDDNPQPRMNFNSTDNDDDDSGYQQNGLPKGTIREEIAYQ